MYTWNLSLESPPTMWYCGGVGTATTTSTAVLLLLLCSWTCCGCRCRTQTHAFEHLLSNRLLLLRTYIHPMWVSRSSASLIISMNACSTLVWCIHCCAHTTVTGFSSRSRESARSGCYRKPDITTYLQKEWGGVVHDEPVVVVKSPQQLQVHSSSGTDYTRKIY